MEKTRRADLGRDIIILMTHRKKIKIRASSHRHGLVPALPEFRNIKKFDLLRLLMSDVDSATIGTMEGPMEIKC